MSSVALHESAHAVMGYLVGLELIEVWIDDGNGLTVHAGPPHMLGRGIHFRDYAVREALATVAPVALGCALSSGDRECLSRVLWLAGFREQPGFIKRRLIEFAREILDTQRGRAACGLLADALCRHSYLEGHEAEIIIKGALDANS